VTVNGMLQVNNNETVTGTLLVGGNVGVTGQMNSAGGSNISNGMTLNGGLNVASGNVAMAGLLTVAAGLKSTGALHFGAITVTLAGTTENINVSNCSLVWLQGSGDVGGLVPAFDGQLVQLVNFTAGPVFLIEESAGSTPANRIAAATGPAQAIASGAAIMLTYATRDSRWHWFGLI
jgi:hypothetical protein